MAFDKQKAGRSLAVGAGVAAAAEYTSAAVINDVHLFKGETMSQFVSTFNDNLMNPGSTLNAALENSAYLDIQPWLLGASAAMAIKLYLEKHDTYELAPEHGAHGTARWSTPKEIAKHPEIETHLKGDGPLLGKCNNKTFSLKADTRMNKNIGIVGGSGAGKTRAHIMGNILKAKEKSMVIIDPKGELYEKTSQMKREQGYEVHLVNFKNRDISDRYNLFDYIKKDSDAFKIAKVLVENAKDGKQGKTDFFEQAQTSVLQACILYVRHALPYHKQHMGSVLKVAQMPIEIFQAESKKFPESHIVRLSFKSAIEQLGDPKTASNVMTTLMQTLIPWQYEDVCSFTSGNDFLFEELGTKKMIVYVIIPVADNEFKPLITTFFTQIFSELYLLADKHQGELPKTVYMALDEFANIGRIPYFEERISTTRSLGIELTPVIQDLSQLEEIYGKNGAKSIMANCDTRILMKANEPETAKYFSNLAGPTTIKFKNKSKSSGSKSSSTNTSYTYTKRDLITPDEVSRLPFNEQLIFLPGEYPMKVKKAWFDQIKQFTKLLGKKVTTFDYPVPDRGHYEAFESPEPDDMKINIGIDNDDESEMEEETLFAGNEEDKQLKNVDQETGEILEDSENTANKKGKKDEQEDEMSKLLDDFNF